MRLRTITKHDRQIQHLETDNGQFCKIEPPFNQAKVNITERETNCRSNLALMEWFHRTGLYNDVVMSSDFRDGKSNYRDVAAYFLF